MSEDHVDDDFGDFTVIEIDRHGITGKEIGSAGVINLDLASGDWLANSATAEMFVLGYPEEYSLVDYERETMTTCRVALQGRYAGASDSDHLHMLKVSSAHSLSTFSGLSGGPVFASTVHPGSRGEMIFCGMVLRGTPASGIIHFLHGSRVLDAVDVFIKRL